MLKPLRKAKQLGWNLFKVAENALKEAFRRLIGMKSETECQDDLHCHEKGAKCGGWDLNPRTSAG